MQLLSGSLAALAVLAARSGNWEDAGRMLIQASAADDSDQFLEEQLQGNYLIDSLADSVSNAHGSLSDSAVALSAALEIVDEQDAAEQLSNDLYGDDEVVDLADSDEDEDGFDGELIFDEDDDIDDSDEEDLDSVDEEDSLDVGSLSNSSSLISF